MWNLTGTAAQQQIVRTALERIKFPFERLTLPGTPELGWRDLNGSDEWWTAKGRFHGDDEHDGDRPEPLNGELEGRKWIMGVFFPMTARIFIDIRLAPRPELAAAVVGAEIAHAVDEFLPMTEGQRAAIMALWHSNGGDGHSWWEKVDYSAEYYTLGGEAFMHEFVNAYSDIHFGDKTAFGHHDAGCEPADIWRILGIPRADAVQFVAYGKSKIYHKLTHYDRPGISLTTLSGYRPCKVCKP